MQKKKCLCIDFSQTNFFLPKKLFDSILRPYVTVTLCKKVQKSSMHWYFMIPEISPFGLISGRFWPKNLKIRFVMKKFIWATFKTSCCCSFMQKIIKIPLADFSKILKKPHYGPILDPLLWKPNSSFLSKNPSPQLFRLDHILTSCKKIRKFLRVFPEKNWQINMGIPTSGQTDKRWEGI